MSDDEFEEETLRGYLAESLPAERMAIDTLDVLARAVVAFSTGAARG